MAAVDLFNKFNALLSKEEAESLRELVKLRRAELLAARSEDARLRLAQSYIEEVCRILGQRSGR